MSFDGQDEAAEAPAVRTDVYVSADIEADGPIPGPYSMLSLGMCIAGEQDGRGERGEILIGAALLERQHRDPEAVVRAKALS